MPPLPPDRPDSPPTLTWPDLPWPVYEVGGAVRDSLMGLPVQDRDWVVVGANPHAMRDQGYRSVGKDFPVFLHPDTHDEIALARTERKTAPGYHGFAFHAAPTVRLEEDLARRDLTLNAIARDRQGRLIDPWGGLNDLKDRVLRHVSPAFAEDPVRILRVARFAARWPDFRIHPDTMALMQAMVQAGEVDALVHERVWQELSRGLMEAQPARMFRVLRECGALARLLPELNALWGVPQRADYHPEVDTGEHAMMVIDRSAALGGDLPVRWAAVGHDLGKGITPAHILPRHMGHEQGSLQLLHRVHDRLHVPVDCKEVALIVAREHGHVHRCLDLSPEATLRLLDRLDAWRRPERLEGLLLACQADFQGRLGWTDKPYVQRQWLLHVHRVARQVDTAQVAAQAQAQGLRGPAIGAAIHAAREALIRPLDKPALPPL